jgi:hypothetical protein
MVESSNEDFAKRMMLLARPADEFRPSATYDADGDCIEFLVKPDPFRAERVDDLVTVYYSQDSGEIIGSLIKGVRRFFQKVVPNLPGLRLVIKDGRVRMEHIFLTQLLLSQGAPTDLATLTYEKLIDVAERADVEAQLLSSHAGEDPLLCGSSG